MPVPRKAKSLKIPSFKHSTKNKSEAAYLDRARVLKKKYGIDFGFSLSKKLTPQRKSAITRQTRKYSGYLNPKNRFKFITAGKATLSAVAKRGDVSDKAFTKKGVFIQAPHTKKRVSVSIKSSGEIRVRVGRRISDYALYKSKQIVTNPEIVLRDAKKRGAQFALVNIKGYAGKTTYDLATFMQYLKDDLIPDIKDAWEDPSKDSAFRNYFGVEFVRFNRSVKKI